MHNDTTHEIADQALAEALIRLQEAKLHLQNSITRLQLLTLQEQTATVHTKPVQTTQQPAS